jgi:predicted Fe-Mo cluster-binding NifX family protein
MMKIALPTRENIVDSHFGHCEKYTIYSVDESKKIIGSEVLPSPQGCGCKSNIAATLREKGVTVMLAGNMGDGALNVLNHYGIEVYRGCTGDVRQVTEAFLQGKVDDSGIGCHHHDHEGEGHVCNH